MEDYSNIASLDPECEAAGKYTAFTFLTEKYTIFNSYDTLHIEASNVPSDIETNTYCLQSTEVCHQ
jgi:hypothetical protein